MKKPKLKSKVKPKAKKKAVKPKVKKCTPRQKRFAKIYVIRLNGKESAIEAGFSKKGAKEAAYRMLTDVHFLHVQKEIKRLMDRVSDVLDVRVERVLLELTKIGFSNMRDYITVTKSGDAFVDLSSLDRDQAAAISEITTEEYTDTEERTLKRTKIKLFDKLVSLDKIGKHLGIFSEKFQHLISKSDNEEFYKNFFGLNK